MPPRQNFPPADRPLLDDHQTLHQELCRHLTVMSGNLQLLERRARRSTAVPSGEVLARTTVANAAVLQLTATLQEMGDRLERFH